jgi:hypothetical protein
MPSDELENRVSALENQVRDLSGRVRAAEQDAAAARVLAGGADRDVSEIRTEIRDFRQATMASFNALREDMLDFRAYVDGRFAQVETGFAQVETGFAKVDSGFAAIRGRLDAAAAGQRQIVELIQTVIDDRRHD